MLAYSTCNPSGLSGARHVLQQIPTCVSADRPYHHGLVSPSLLLRVTSGEGADNCQQKGCGGPQEDRGKDQAKEGGAVLQACASPASTAAPLLVTHVQVSGFVRLAGRAAEHLTGHTSAGLHHAAAVRLVGTIVSLRLQSRREPHCAVTFAGRDAYQEGCEGREEEGGGPPKEGGTACTPHEEGVPNRVLASPCSSPSTLCSRSSACACVLTSATAGGVPTMMPSTLCRPWRAWIAALFRSILTLSPASCHECRS